MIFELHWGSSPILEHCGFHNIMLFHGSLGLMRSFIRKWYCSLDISTDGRRTNGNEVDNNLSLSIYFLPCAYFCRTIYRRRGSVDAATFNYTCPLQQIWGDPVIVRPLIYGFGKISANIWFSVYQYTHHTDTGEGERVHAVIYMCLILFW